MKINQKLLMNLAGVAIVVGTVWGLFSYLVSVNSVGKIASGVNTELENVGKFEYVVAKGDTLWAIAEKNLGTGYGWVEIANTNKSVISNPDVLEAGMKITIPAPKITDHTVVLGDNLWDLGVRYCNNGFAWTNIATFNNLENPRVIEIGQLLKIKCI